MDKNKIESCFELIKTNKSVFFNFLKAKYPFFHNSNFFFRDFQFGIKNFLEKKGTKISYPEAEALANIVGKYLENEKIFFKINSNTWRVNYPEFVTKVPGDPFDLKIVETQS